MLTQMITETLLGALTGYVTNHTAIRSLFQPGGVIEHTRDDFAREAGELLEEQVLTRAVLKQQLELSQMQQALNDALEDFWLRTLPQSFADKTLGDLPDYDKCLAVVQQLVVQFAEQERERILLWLKTYLPVQKIFTEAQCQQFSGRLEALLLETVQQEDLAVCFLNAWKQEKGAQTLEELGLRDLCSSLVMQTAQQGKRWKAQLLQQHETELKALLLETIQKLQLHSVLSELDEQMLQYTLRQYLHCDEETLSRLLYEAAGSEAGQQLLKVVTDELVKALATVDVPIGELIPEDLLTGIAQLLEQQMPVILESLLEWLQGEEQAVAAMLESAVDEVAAELGGMKGMLLAQLKESLLEQVLQETNLGDLVQQFLLTPQTTKEAAALLTATIKEQLTIHPVGALVQRMNGNGQLVQVVQLFLTKNIQRLLSGRSAAFLQSILAWQPGSFHLTERRTELEHWLTEILWHGMVQLDVEALLKDKGDWLCQVPTSQLLPWEDEQVRAWVNGAIRQGCKHLAETLPQISSDAFYRPLYHALEQVLRQQGAAWLAHWTSSCPMEQILVPLQGELLAQKPQMVQQLTQMGVELLEGRLSKLAEGQIQKLSNEDMRKLVEDFMGRELQPLNYLGAGMGAVAGITVGTTMSAALPVTAAAAPAVLLGALAGKSFLFGAVGYGTNCAAVKGLFWPYEPVGGMEMLQGVIPKQKARFAHSMGNLVERYVLNEEILQQKLEYSEKILSVNIKQLAENEKVWQSFMAEAVHRRRALVRACLAQLEKQSLSKYDEALLHLGSQPFAFLRNDLWKTVQLENYLLPWAEQWLQRQLHGEITLNAILSDEQFGRYGVQWLSGQRVPNVCRWADTLLHSEKSVAQLLTQEKLQSYAEAIQDRVHSWLSEPAHGGALAQQLSQFFTVERLKQWLERHSGAWLETNLSGLFALVEQTCLKLIQQKERDIVERVQRAILSKMGFMQQMGYSMMGGDEIVAQVVARILRQKLPIFLSLKSKDLQLLLARCWQQAIFPALLESPMKQEHIGILLYTLLRQPAVHQGVADIAKGSTLILAQQPLNSWGRWLNPEPLLEKVQLQLGFQWKLNSSLAVQHWQPLLQDFYKETIGKTTLGQLTRDFHGTVPLAQILQHDALAENLRGAQLRLQENMAITRPQQWLCWTEFTEVLGQALQGLEEDQSFRRWCQYEGETLLIQLSADWRNLLPSKTREALMEVLLQAFSAAARAHGKNLLSAMELSQLAERQLLLMDSAHLEQVVRGFASQYLTHIENRGWLGAVFALPGMLLYLL